MPLNSHEFQSRQKKKFKQIKTFFRSYFFFSSCRIEWKQFCENLRASQSSNASIIYFNNTQNNNHIYSFPPLKSSWENRCNFWDVLLFVWQDERKLFSIAPYVFFHFPKFVYITLKLLFLYSIYFLFPSSIGRKEDEFSGFSIQ